VSLGGNKRMMSFLKESRYWQQCHQMSRRSEQSVSKVSHSF